MTALICATQADKAHSHPSFSSIKLWLHTDASVFHSVSKDHTANSLTPRLCIVVKALRRKTNEGPKFDKDNTVFRDWHPPTEKDLQKML